MVPKHSILIQGLIVPFRYPPTFISFSMKIEEYKSIFRPQDYKITPNTSIIPIDKRKHFNCVAFLRPRPHESIFKKTWVHTYRFRIVFARPHYNAVSVLKTLLYPQCACSNELDTCAFQYIGLGNWREIEATW